MGPKKAVTEANIASVNVPEKVVKEDMKPGASEESVKAVRKASLHPPTMEMVKEALKELDQRKGVSTQAIRTFIKEKYKTVDETRLKLLVRKALVKGTESGVFVRPGNSTTMTGAQGRFRLAVRKPTKVLKPAKSKESKENKNPNVGKDEDAKGGAKKKPAKTQAAKDDAKPKAKELTASKVAPAKRPKAKSSETDKPEAQTKSKTGEDSGKANKKKAAEKAAYEGVVTSAPEKVKGDQKAEGAAVKAVAHRKGKKVVQKTDGEPSGTSAPKATGRKGKRAAQK